MPSNCKIIDWEEKYLFIDPEAPNWTCVNSTGALILALCDGKNSIRDITSIVSKLLNSNQEVVNEEVAEFVASLASYSFLSLNNYAKNSIYSTNLPYPQMIYYNVTNKCNLKCPFCYISAGGQLEDELNHEEAVKCIDEIASLKPQTLVFSGGEPLMREDLFDLAGYAKEKKLRIVLISNGTLINDRIAERLTIFDAIQISLEGSTSAVHDKLRGAGTFDLVLNSIKLLKKAGVKRVIISPVLTRINAHDLPNLLDMVTKFRLGKVKLNVFVPVGRGQSNQELSLSPHIVAAILNDLNKTCLKTGEEYLDLMDEKTTIFSRFVKKMNCGAGTGVLSIAANGDVYPCHAFHVPEFKAGTIKNDSLETIYRDSLVFAKFREATVDSIEKCKDCYLRYLCGGGCRASGYYLKKSLLSPDPECQVYKSLIEMKMKFELSRN
jgi:radical SAM protein with 4Fe4S-binding SPASM domain